MTPLLVPWKIIANAASFLTFLGSYTVLLMPICGVMICDYYIIRKGNIHIPSIYDKSHNTLYMFYHGWNLRAVAAWVAGVAFTIHGIAGNLNPDSVSAASKNMYKLGFILSGLMGFLMYWALCLIWQIPVLPSGHEGQLLTFEELAPNQGFFEGEGIDDITGEVQGVRGSDHGRESVSDTKIAVGEKVPVTSV